MTQFVIIDEATRRVLGGRGRRDPVDMTGPPDEMPDAEPGTVLVAWQGVLNFSGGLGVMEWLEGATEPSWRDDRTIEECKAEKNAEINQKRLAANRTSFPFAGKSIACDELSMLDIQSLNGIVALIGDLPPGFANQWKAIDNTYVAIPDKSTWIAFIGAMVSTGQANFDHSQALKVTLAEATTNAAVDGITW
jgi:hypothetical protein